MGRVFLRPDDGVDYNNFIDDLKKTGYDSRISVGAFTDDFEAHAPLASRTVGEAAR